MWDGEPLNGTVRHGGKRVAALGNSRMLVTAAGDDDNGQATNEDRSTLTHLPVHAQEALLQLYPMHTARTDAYTQEEIADSLHAAMDVLASPTGLAPTAGPALALLSNANVSPLNGSPPLTVVDFSLDQYRPALRALATSMGACTRYLECLSASASGSLSAGKPKSNLTAVNVERVQLSLHVIISICTAITGQKGPVKLIMMALQSAKTCASICLAVCLSFSSRDRKNMGNGGNGNGAELMLLAFQASCAALKLACSVVNSTCGENNTTPNSIFPLDGFSIARESYHSLVAVANTPTSTSSKECSVDLGGCMWQQLLDNLSYFAPRLPAELRSSVPQLVPQECLPLLRAHRQSRTVPIPVISSRIGADGGDAATADVVVTGPRAWQHDRVVWNKLLQRSSQYGREKVDLRDCTTSTRTGADAAVVKEEHNGDGGIASVLVPGRNGVVGGKRRRGGGAD